MTALPPARDLDALLRGARRGRLWEPGPETRSLNLRGEAMQALLPHRPPMLLLDAVTAIDIGRGLIAGERWLNPADPVFAGHFPGRPLYPGVLQIEALGQLAACFRPIELGAGPEELHLLSCRATFLEPLHPGDRLELLGLRLGRFDGLMERGVGQILRDGVVCATALVEGVYAGR